MSMPMRVVDFTGPGGVGVSANATGNTPCLTGRRPGSMGQSGVRLGETLQLRFEGTPPFNLTQSICENPQVIGSSCWCPVTSTILTTNSYNWTVSSYNYTNNGTTREIFTNGSTHSLIWTATEQRVINMTYSPFYTSPNFSLSATSYDRPAEGGAQRYAPIGLAAWAVLWMTIISLIMSLHL